MRFSLCIPVHNRLNDALNSLPYWIDAINEAPGSEVVILDYGSSDGLSEYIRNQAGEYEISDGNEIRIERYSGRDYYHMAHARNLSVLAAGGEFIIILSADIYPRAGMVALMAELMKYRYPEFYYVQNYRGVICLRRKDFIAAGGYDERFEFYSPEDKDLHERLIRRGLTAGWISSSYIQVTKTPNDIKIQGYRLSLTKREMAKQMETILFENRRAGALVANPNGWGSWI